MKGKAESEEGEVKREEREGRRDAVQKQEEGKGRRREEKALLSSPPVPSLRALWTVTRRRFVATPEKRGVRWVSDG